MLLRPSHAPENLTLALWSSCSGEPLQAFGKTKRHPVQRKGEVGMGKGREENQRGDSIR